MGMVHHDAAPDLRAGMDIHAEQLGGPHLHEISHVAATVREQPMRDPVALQRLKPLEEQQRLDQPVAGRVALVHGHQIGPRRLPQGGIGSKGFLGDLTQKLLAHLRRGQFHRETIGQRPFERRVMQEPGMDQGPQKRLVTHRSPRLVANLRPDRIDGGNLGHLLVHRITPSSRART